MELSHIHLAVDATVTPATVNRNESCEQRLNPKQKYAEVNIWLNIKHFIKPKN